MAPTYTYAQLSFVRQQLADRLYDSGMVFWSSAELTTYLQEALRTWNALTAFWRGDFTFPSQAATTWYDLTDQANLPNTLRPLTITDRDLYTVMQYHLLEPIAWNPWTGASVQFSESDLQNAVQRRRDEILSTCGCTQTRRIVGAVAGRITLNDKVIDVRRMAYLPNSPSSPSVVWPDDTWAEQSFQPRYTTTPAGTPSQYLMSTQPPISFDVDRPPAYAGSYELLTVDAGAALDVATPTLMPIADDWTHVIKWGALADLFGRESNAKDVLRQQYCEQRYQMGLKLLSNAPALLAMRIGNTPLQIDSVRSADLYNTSWQALAAGTPGIALHSGLNLVALSPVPDAGPYTLTATVVENAPVPTVDADYIQLGRDDLDVVIDYAQHLASLKMGGEEFSVTIPLFKRFMNQAQIYNAKLKELGEYTTAIYNLSQRENDMNPVAQPVDSIREGE